MTRKATVIVALIPTTLTNNSYLEHTTAAYSHEPEYQEAEIRKLPPFDNTSDNYDEEVDLNSSRLENLH